jgi:hypothetical protein
MLLNISQDWSTIYVSKKIIMKIYYVIHLMVTTLYIYVSK